MTNKDGKYRKDGFVGGEGAHSGLIAFSWEPWHYRPIMGGEMMVAVKKMKSTGSACIKNGVWYPLAEGPSIKWLDYQTDITTGLSKE